MDNLNLFAKVETNQFLKPQIKPGTLKIFFAANFMPADFLIIEEWQPFVIAPVVRQHEDSTLPGPSSKVPASWPSFALAFAASCITVGIIWDISWHETIGRDTWTPAHLAIYLGGALGGFIGGWLAVYHTFLADPSEKAAAVCVFGARAPLGAWITIWGAVAMLTAGPFDNWWHNAYGLDVKIISPPHALLGLGMFGLTFGALITVLSRQNRLQNGAGSGLFIFVSGMFVVMAGRLHHGIRVSQHATRGAFLSGLRADLSISIGLHGTRRPDFLASHPHRGGLYSGRMPDDLDPAALSRPTPAGTNFQSGYPYGSPAFSAPAHLSSIGD